MNPGPSHQDAVRNASTAQTPSPRHESALARWLDGATDLAVLAFAAWTLLYQAAQLLGWPTDPIVITWAVLLVALGAAVVRQFRNRPSAPSAVDAPTLSWRSPWLAISVVLALGSAVVVRDATGVSWRLGWVLAAVSGLIAVVHLVRASHPSPSDRPHPHSAPSSAPSSAPPSAAAGSERQPVRLRSHVLALVVGLGWAAFSLFTLRRDPDDVFYVNKAVFVAEHGLIPGRDTIFGDQTLPALPGAGTAPLQSIEVLQGALARFLSLDPTALVYLGFPPLLTFLATWSIWRLVREWSRARATLAFAVSMVYLAMAANTPAGVGVFFLARIWQGKVVFVAALIPLIYLYITRWAHNGSRWQQLMLASAGIAAVGLTSSATFIVPIIAVSCATALLVTRRRWVGVLALAAYPVITGGVVALAGVPGDPGGRFRAGDVAFHFVLGTGLLAAIGWAGILLAGWLSVSGATRVVATAAALSLLVVLAPGVAGLFSSATGAGAVAWRLMWVAPVTVMVGLLATVPLARAEPVAGAWSMARRMPAFAVAAALVAALVVTGTPFWSPVRDVEVKSVPTWKYPSLQVQQALAIRRLDPGPGPVLAPLRTMRALSLVSSEVHAVAALPSYISILTEPPREHEARITLTEVFGGTVTSPRRTHSQQQFTAALSTLEVSMTCVYPSQQKLSRWLREAGWKPQPVRELSCYTP
ncbi:hypothetical protein BA895_09630 [Humibacillus sp. DSM 29435]|uniref:DUF6077 domain-containing protein n=1 Tax=Humibacillus sp. DSM 29435 TaxID=1869167 RepID=UPI00087290EF|nr:DUF6077 domain-containing protein [Humibacillus sp. DSM 29435]OFE14608.1 hypothetical protein BA895_09630 [Humibacillus sp. DSM 29435]